MTTAHLAQTMFFLSLTADELKQKIEAAIASNPALELHEERTCPTCHRILPPKGPCPICTLPTADDPIIFVSPSDDFYPHERGMVEDTPEDDYSTVQETLPTYVFRQIAPELATEDRPIAAYLLTHLDDDGLLTISLAEIARYYHVSLDRVEKVRKLIQRADPLGVGSSTPQEAVLAQLDFLEESKSLPRLARPLINLGLDTLSKRQYPELARQFKTSVNEIREVLHYISENLSPYPGRMDWGENRREMPQKSRVFYKPDIIISQPHDTGMHNLMVEIILPIHGTLRVNPLFREAILQASTEQKEGLKEDYEKALLFVKCLQQRNHTMERLMQKLVTLQRDFILRGDKFLRPVTRAKIAKELDVHESTISRAVANKAVQLPNGHIIPLSDFFDRSLSIRKELKEIIDREARPLSDSDLVELLAQRGYSIARRTVAKYRAIEGILPANMRHISD
ncbi:MAG TPA: hypothetical protein VIO61_12070 [Anaerolineaceae bacterium]